MQQRKYFLAGLAALVTMIFLSRFLPGELGSVLGFVCFWLSILAPIAAWSGDFDMWPQTKSFLRGLGCLGIAVNWVGKTFAESVIP